MNLEHAREISERELRKAQPRIGQPCEAHTEGEECGEPSTHALGDWYPRPGSYVHCEQHITCGYGALTQPDLPDGHPKVRSLSERHKFGV